MKELNLRYHSPSIDEIKSVINILEVSKDLKSLSLEFYNMTTNSNLPMLFAVLENNQTLVKLELCQCIIDTSLLKLFRLNTILKTLILENNNINLNFQIITNILENNQTLTTLHLQNNNIDSTLFFSLAKALEKNTTLTDLNLDNNYVGNGGILYLANLLETNTTLKNISLKCNNIVGLGVTYLFDTLKVNATLKRISLDNNIIGDAGMFYLAEALKTNATLTKLSLVNCKIGNDGLQYILDTLKTNATLVTIDLTSKHNWNHKYLNLDGLNLLETMLYSNYIRNVNKKKLCLQIVCLKKINQLGKTKEIKTLMPAIFESCMEKYNRL